MSKNKGLEYTADDSERPTEVTFDNGRRVRIANDEKGHFLVVDMAEKEKAMNRKEAIKAAADLLKDNPAAAEIVKGLSRTRKPKSKAAPAETPAATPAPAAN